MKERSSIGVGHRCMRSGACVTSNRGNPIELHLSFVAERELKRGVALKRDAPGAGNSFGGRKLGSNKDRQMASLSTFKRLARRRGSFDLFARSFASPRFDRAGLQIAWKYVYLVRAGHRLTRYVE